ncbi:MAG TPA: M20/M25/M40 family metallo-hydrolase, partial [Acidimicrobiia bacterium]|nr:M20/M25/M40 family metallo-hydrolase [Acidimicrobiia bacterium]
MTQTPAASGRSSNNVTAQDEVAGLCSDLIRIDTSNRGDNQGPGERQAAEYVAGLLAEVGLEPTILESDKSRASVITRITGEDQTRPALLIHGHLDVVPADAADWQVDPFSGHIGDASTKSTSTSGTGQDDPCVWGRGAVDMKDMDAMILAVVRQRLREGRRPPRDVVLAFLADEEAGGSYGARFLVDNHPGLFEGVTEAVGEVGGFSVTLGGQRLYLIQTAEKGMAWLRLTARGTAGHGSMLQPDNAVTELAETVARIGRHDWPVRLTPAVEAFLAEACTALGLEYGPESYRQVIDKIGSLSRLTGATLRNTLNPTVLKAGYKVNVVPQVATADVDGRFLPGYEDEFFAEVDSLLGPGVEREFIHHDIALETTFDGDLCDAMTAALLAEDPGARVVPYCLS